MVITMMTMMTMLSNPLPLLLLLPPVTATTAVACCRLLQKQHRTEDSFSGTVHRRENMFKRMVKPKGQEGLLPEGKVERHVTLLLPPLGVDTLYYCVEGLGLDVVTLSC